MTTTSPRATSTRTTTETSTSASARSKLVFSPSEAALATKRAQVWQVDNVGPDKSGSAGVTSSDKIQSISRKTERVRKELASVGGKAVALPPHNSKSASARVREKQSRE